MPCIEDEDAVLQQLDFAQGGLALDEAGEHVMLRALNCLQGAFYINLSRSRQKDETFLYGWLDNRVAI